MTGLQRTCRLPPIRRTGIVGTSLSGIQATRNDHQHADVAPFISCNANLTRPFPLHASIYHAYFQVIGVTDALVLIEGYLWSLLRLRDRMLWQRVGKRKMRATRTGWFSRVLDRAPARKQFRATASLLSLSINAPRRAISPAILPP